MRQQSPQTLRDRAPHWVYMHTGIECTAPADLAENSHKKGVLYKYFSCNIQVWG